MARLAAALGEICVSDAQGRSGADISIFDISLTPADLAWLEDDPLRRLRLLAPDPGDRIRAPRCSGDAFPWQRANVVAVDADQPLSALIGGDAQAGGTRPAGCVRHLGRRVPKVIQRALFAARLARNVRPGAVGTGLADVRGFGGRILRELAGFAGFAVAVLIPGRVVPPRNAVRARACRIYVFLPGGAGFAGAVCCTLRERVVAGSTRLARTSRLG